MRPSGEGQRRRKDKAKLRDSVDDDFKGPDTQGDANNLSKKSLERGKELSHSKQNGSIVAETNKKATTKNLLK